MGVVMMCWWIIVCYTPAAFFVLFQRIYPYLYTHASVLHSHLNWQLSLAIWFSFPFICQFVYLFVHLFIPSCSLFVLFFRKFPLFFRCLLCNLVRNMFSHIIIFFSQTVFSQNIRGMISVCSNKYVGNCGFCICWMNWKFRYVCHLPICRLCVITCDM